MDDQKYESWVLEATMKVSSFARRECCWLPRSATDELNKLGMSTGDQRAWMDRYGCSKKATWTIQSPYSPYDVIESCDAHKDDLMDIDDVAVPL